MAYEHVRDKNVLDALEKLRKATISFVMSVRPSVLSSLRIELDPHFTDFHELFMLRIFRKYFK
jgi:hypothetical protein